MKCPRIDHNIHLMTEPCLTEDLCAPEITGNYSLFDLTAVSAVVVICILFLWSVVYRLNVVNNYNSRFLAFFAFSSGRFLRG